MKILEIEHLSKTYNKYGSRELFDNKIKKEAVIDASFAIKQGEIVALVGESGSGKSTLLKIIMGITDYEGGAIKLLGKDIKNIAKRNLRSDIKCVFQNPYESFDLKHTLRYSLVEALKVNKVQNIDAYISKQCANYDIDESMIDRYPNEISGGQLQRISIMRSLMLNPKLIICDEIISALDISLQLRILDIIKKARREKNLACLFITHNIALIKNFADRVVVMKDGKIVEIDSTKHIFSNPQNAYTKALIDSMPVIASKAR